MASVEQMVTDLPKNGFLAIAMAMGWKTGLFDVILAIPEPATSAEIASKAKLKERYVREWLLCMHMWGVVEMEPASSKYHIPQARRQVVESSMRQVGLISALITRFSSIASCFPENGPSGLSFGADGGNIMFDCLATMENASSDDAIDKDYLADIPGLKEKLEAGMDVAEFGSNAGATIIRLAQRFPKSRFHGSDVMESLVKDANARVKELGLSNVTFHVIDLCDLPSTWVNAFDWMFVRDVVHDLPFPERGVENMTSCLRKDGLCSVLDINASSDRLKNAGQPGMDMLSTLSLFFCVPHALHGNPESTALGTLWGVEKGKQLLTAYGLTLLHCGTANFSPDLYHYVLRK